MSYESRSAGLRKGIKDIWGAWMVGDARWDEEDIPFCETTADGPPSRLISFHEAKRIYNREMRAGNLGFHVDAYVHFYCDDQKFDGEREGIWRRPERAIEIIRHFSGLITPDSSTYADMPDPIKRVNTYRMRAFGHYAAKRGLKVINNVRWGTVETWSYCFRGIEKHDIVAIGTVASNPWKLDNRPLFEEGLREMARVLEPRIIVVYGSAGNPVFAELRAQGITVVAFSSQTNEAHGKKVAHE